MKGVNIKMGLFDDELSEDMATSNASESLESARRKDVKKSKNKTSKNSTAGEDDVYANDVSEDEVLGYDDEKSNVEDASYAHKTDFSFRLWEVGIIVIEIILVLYTLLVMAGIAPFF